MPWNLSGMGRRLLVSRRTRVACMDSSPVRVLNTVPFGGHDVAQVPVLEGGIHLFAHVVARDVNLDAAGASVLQRGKAGLAHHALEHHAPGHAGGGLGDVAVLMLTLPDWLAGLLASGALAYVLLPHWARQAPAAQAATQRAVAWRLLALGGMLGLAIWIGRGPLVVLLAAGLAPDLRGLAGQSLGWSALALPAALLAALWATRLQHERDFVGMYGANLVVNGVLVIALLLIAVNDPSTQGLIHLGGYFLLAMGLRLGWLFWRQRARPGLAAAVIGRDETVPEIRNEARGTQRPGLPQVADSGQRSVPTPAHLPATSVWLWAALSAGLPLALPFAARSMASSGGEGALATFNYAWKLVELPLILAIQLVATLAFPAITQAFARDAGAAGQPGADATQRSEMPLHLPGRWPAQQQQGCCWARRRSPSCCSAGVAWGRMRSRAWRPGAPRAPGGCCRRR
jgi:hypothetical protein